VRYPSRFPPLISNAKTEIVKTLTQNFARTTHCGFNLNSISFYSFTSIDSFRPGKSAAALHRRLFNVVHQTVHWKTANTTRWWKRIKKQSFIMCVLFEMVDITTPVESSAVCVFLNSRYRNKTVLLPRISFLFFCWLPKPRHFEVTVLFGFFTYLMECSTCL
jgi:hypothetical protein